MRAKCRPAQAKHTEALRTDYVEQFASRLLDVVQFPNDVHLLFIVIDHYLHDVINLLIIQVDLYVVPHLIDDLFRLFYQLSFDLSKLLEMRGKVLS